MSFIYKYAAAIGSALDFLTADCTQKWHFLAVRAEIVCPARYRPGEPDLS